MRLWIKTCAGAASLVVAMMTSCGPPAPCDSSDTCDQCLVCAEDGPCRELFEACNEIADCFPFGSCAADCAGDPSCQETCAEKFPAGAEPAHKLSACLVCDQCQKRCPMFTEDCGK